ncbi:MAG: signal peptidase II [Thermoguttaceae bacterium]
MRLFLLRLSLFLSLAVGGFALDLATKDWAFRRLGLPGEQPPFWIIDGVCGVQTSLNEGALFGMGQGFVHVFSAIACLALVGVVVWFCVAAWRSLFFTTLLGAITAGITGNLWDRLGLHEIQAVHADGTRESVYAVRDWILVMIGSYHWPNFNIADSLLVVSAIAIGVYAFLSETSSK